MNAADRQEFEAPETTRAILPCLGCGLATRHEFSEKERIMVPGLRKEKGEHILETAFKLIYECQACHRLRQWGLESKISDYMLAKVIARAA